jgi:hypothetical protein
MLTSMERNPDEMYTRRQLAPTESRANVELEATGDAPGTGWYGVRVEGTLTVEKGATLTQLGGTNAVEAFKLVARGTSSQKVVLEGEYKFGDAEMEYVHYTGRVFAVRPRSDLHSGQLEGSGAGWITDSTIGDGSHITVFWWRPADGVTATIEHNLFEEEARLGVFRADVKRNVFKHPGRISREVVQICEECFANQACTGDRSADPELDFRDNVIAGTWDRNQDVYHVSRGFGPIDVSGNYYESSTPTDDGWDGGTSGCSDSTGQSDGMGAQGGPLTVEPALDTPPATAGPR